MQAIEEAVLETITCHRDQVQAWQENRPGSWGYLAARAVLTCRHLLGRRLSETERRAVWQRLWERLQEPRSE